MAAPSCCTVLAMLLLHCFLKGCARGPSGDVFYHHRRILEGEAGREEMLGLKSQISLVNNVSKQEGKNYVSLQSKDNSNF